MELTETRAKLSPIDVASTAILYTIAVMIALVSIFLSSFFVMATDSCAPDNCRTGYVTAAYYVTWGGTAAALAGPLAMIGVAAVKRWSMWIWPAIAIVAIVVAFLLGGSLADNASR